MKPLVWKGDSKRLFLAFPASVQHHGGFELLALQRGLQPSDFKPMPSIGSGVEEIRIWAESGTYRVVYIARRPEAVYVLHAFQKKTQQTNLRDIELARSRFAQLRSGQM